MWNPLSLQTGHSLVSLRLFGMTTQFIFGGQAVNCSLVKLASEGIQDGHGFRLLVCAISLGGLRLGLQFGGCRSPVHPPQG